MVGAGGSRGGNKVVLVLAGKFFEGFALRLGNKEGREDTSEHEEGEDFEDMGHKRVLTTLVLELEGDDLSDDGTEFAGGGRDTVSGRSVTSREDFSGNDESSSVGSKVLHKVGSAVEEDESTDGVLLEFVVSESHAAEEDSEDDETGELERLATPFVDEEEGGPESGNESSNGDD